MTGASRTYWASVNSRDGVDFFAGLGDPDNK